MAIALVRGFSRRNSPTIGNFWVDMTRGLLYIVFPIAFVAGIIFVGQGAVQTLAGTVSIHDSLNGVSQTIARGPIGFMEAIKQLGNNGGGFLNANSATTFENPTGLTNWLSIYLLLAIPFALTYTFGKMVGSIRHGAALLAAMVIIFGVWVAFTSVRRAPDNPAVAAAGVHSTVGNTEGKEVRFGDTTTALFGVASTSTSTGSADASYDSFTPMGGFGLDHRHDARRGDPGRRGQRPLHHPDLRHHRRVHRRSDDRANTRVPRKEDPGHGGQTRGSRGPRHADHRAHLHRHRRVDPRRAGGPHNAGPHGFTEILYALTSQGNNNGSAFAGLTGNTTFYNVIGGIDMLIGRFGIMIPALALGGVLAAKNVVPAGARHLPHRQPHVRRPDHRRHRDHRWPHLLPGRRPRPHRRAAQPRKVLLMTA